MIVRIQGEGQFELDDSAKSELERLDRELFEAINHGEEETFRAAVASVDRFIRTQGVSVPNDRLVTSDLILPDPDMTLDDAKRLLTDEGYLEPVEA